MSRDKPVSDVPMPLPWHPRTARGNTVLSGFFEHMGGVGDKRKKWLLARKSLGGTRGRSVFWEKTESDICWALICDLTPS